MVRESELAHLESRCDWGWGGARGLWPCLAVINRYDEEVVDCVDSPDAPGADAHEV